MRPSVSGDLNYTYGFNSGVTTFGTVLMIRVRIFHFLAFIHLTLNSKVIPLIYTFDIGSCNVILN